LKGGGGLRVAYQCLGCRGLRLVVFPSAVEAVPRCTSRKPGM
jgi:hypothetical protein